MKKTLSIYLHIPFCVRKCHYCDFCSFPGRDAALMTAYTDELCRRMKEALPPSAQWQTVTVYFGGGTPTLLPLPCFEKLMDTLRACTDLAPDAEITAECNPATADRSYLSALRALGINRLSIGLQSVHDRELKTLGRIHTCGDFLKTYDDARTAGFDNLSVDLMYALPGGSYDRFCESLDTLIALGPEHISAYGLKIEDGTYFAKHQKELNLPDEDTEFRMYRAMTEHLSAAGYHKYEISNFAKPGFASRHNLGYWQGRDYLGFGVAAHSCFEGVRFGNSRDMDAFLRGEDITEERIILSEEDRRSEWLMLSMRLTEGISEEEYQKRFKKNLAEAYPALPRWLAEGYVTKQNGRLAFTDRGFFVSNAILAELLEE